MALRYRKFPALYALRKKNDRANPLLCELNLRAIHSCEDLDACTDYETSPSELALPSLPNPQSRYFRQETNPASVIRNPRQEADIQSANVAK